MGSSTWSVICCKRKAEKVRVSPEHVLRAVATAVGLDRARSTLGSSFRIGRNSLEVQCPSSALGPGLCVQISGQTGKPPQFRDLGSQPGCPGRKTVEGQSASGGFALRSHIRYYT